MTCKMIDYNQSRLLSILYPQKEVDFASDLVESSNSSTHGTFRKKLSLKEQKKIKNEIAAKRIWFKNGLSYSFSWQFCSALYFGGLLLRLKTKNKKKIKKLKNTFQALPVKYPSLILMKIKIKHLNVDSVSTTPTQAALLAKTLSKIAKSAFHSPGPAMELLCITRPYTSLQKTRFQ